MSDINVVKKSKKRRPIARSRPKPTKRKKTGRPNTGSSRKQNFARKRKNSFKKSVKKPPAKKSKPEIITLDSDSDSEPDPDPESDHNSESDLYSD